MSTTYTNTNGIRISIDRRVAKQLGLRAKDLSDDKPTHMQHANSIVDLATGQRRILSNNVAEIAAEVQALAE